MNKIKPHLWYNKEAEEAARLYTSIFPDSRITRINSKSSETPDSSASSFKVVEFLLFGQAFIAISAGPLDAFNHAISFVVECDDQAEIDFYWDALLKDGGQSEQCGWLKDRFGLCWQIVPRALNGMLADSDSLKVQRAMNAMLKMTKFDIGALQAAFDGRAA